MNDTPPKTPSSAAEHLFPDDGEMGALVRAMDWSRTRLGPTESWPTALRTIVGVVLGNRFPMMVWWGTHLVQIYNDGYRAILGDKHPRSLGECGEETWKEVWGLLGPLAHGVLNGGPAVWFEHMLLNANRRGFLEETYFTFSYSPVPDDQGGRGGVLVTVQETSGQVLGERRLHVLQRMAADAFQARSEEEAAQLAMRALAEQSEGSALRPLLRGGRGETHTPRWWRATGCAKAPAPCLLRSHVHASRGGCERWPAPTSPRSSTPCPSPCARRSAARTASPPGRGSSRWKAPRAARSRACSWWA